jgi:hypothetical protein
VRTSISIALCLSLVAACKKGKDKDAAPSATVATTSTATATASAKAPARPARPAWVNEAGRQGKCEFQKWEGEGKERKAMFKVSGPAGKEVDSLQTWLFYYDKDGKFIDRYPHATFISGDGSSDVRRLGQTGDDIYKGTETVECEITRLTFKDKTHWWNENLIPETGDRPKGGVTDTELKAHSGEKVEVEVVDGKTGKVKLRNTSGKEVKSVSVEMIFFKADKSKDDYVSEWLEGPLKPGEVVEKQLKIDKPHDFATVEAYAPEVRFSDDSEFSNKNLEGFNRPG